MTRALLLLTTAFAFAGTATTNILLSRIDTARAEAHRAYAHTAVLRVELDAMRATIAHRDLKPANVIDEVCRRRTTALRGALFALVRTGAVSMTGDPGGEWITWK
jgi:hypothetical protein